MPTRYEQQIDQLNRRNPVLNVYRFDEIQRAAAIQLVHHGNRILLTNGQNYILPMEEGRERALFTVSAEALTAGMMSGTFSRGTYSPDALGAGDLFCINTKADLERTDPTEYFKVHSVKIVPLEDLALIMDVFAKTVADWRKKSEESLAATEAQLKQAESQLFALRRKKEGLVAANEERKPKLEDVLKEMY